MDSAPVEVQLKDVRYPIHIQAGLFDRLAVELGKWNARCAVISDETVGALYGERLHASLKTAGVEYSAFSVPDGESTKSLVQVESLCQALIKRRFDRRCLIVALGGGVVGDLAGFVAASYLRGVGLVQVPSTLLAQVDSSVGGKVGVNLPQAKNSVGAFWHPRAVFADPTLLTTLDEANYTAGLAEVVKYGVILEASFFEYLEANVEAIVQRQPDVLTRIIQSCCRLKAAVVQEDERETTGRRAILNYGHTFGHAIETQFGYGCYLHGHAVGIGMTAAARLAHLMGRVDQAFVDRQTALLSDMGIPTKYPESAHSEMLELMRHDKKVMDGKLQFVLPTRLGQVELVSSIDQRLVIEAMRQSS